MTQATGLTGAQALQRIQQLKQATDNPPETQAVLSRLAQFEMSAGMLKRRKIELEEELEQVNIDLHRAEGSIGALQQMVLDFDVQRRAEEQKAAQETAAKKAAAAKGGKVVDGPGKRPQKPAGKNATPPDGEEAKT